jgi:glycosyltransferase involved in cell wall biosynthesis
MPNGVPAVSVIVPVYDNARFLRRCLDSLRRQMLKDIEVVCIDDGSTDGSSQILAAYASADTRFRVISKANSGYGASMNRGLEEARGDFVGIVEADDFASVSMYRRLLATACRFDADVVRSNYFEHEQGSLTRVRDRRLEVFAGLPYGRPFDPYEHQGVFHVRPCIWTGLYRRSFLERFDIRFLETPGASFQDTSFNFKVWASARRAVLLKSALLHYRIDNSASSVRSCDKVYAVCAEYRSSESFLEQNPALQERYAQVLNAVRIETYWWNYYRIAPEHRAAFLDHAAAEFRREEEVGHIVESCFSSRAWRSVRALVEDPEAFAATEAEGMWF